MCAFSEGELFSWGNSYGFPHCLQLSALPCASPEFLSEPFRASECKRKALEEGLWSDRVLTFHDARSVSREEISKGASGAHTCRFLDLHVCRLLHRITCLKKDYLAGSCLPNISLEQVFTAEIQWPDSNVYDRNSASYLMPATHWPLSHWKTLLSQ